MNSYDLTCNINFWMFLLHQLSCLLKLYILTNFFQIHNSLCDDSEQKLSTFIWLPVSSQGCLGTINLGNSTNKFIRLNYTTEIYVCMLVWFAMSFSLKGDTKKGKQWRWKMLKWSNSHVSEQWKRINQKRHCAKNH